jgi:stage II sporulation protein M
MALNKRRYVWCFSLCLAVFLVGFLIGNFITFPEGLIPEQSLKADASVAARIRNVSTLKTILFNNSKVFLMLAIGILTCGILSVIFSLLMGGFIGLLVNFILTHGGSRSLVLASMVPHGIFEMTAFVGLAALGVYFAWKVYDHTEGRDVDWVSEAKTYGLFALIVYVIVVVAAFIETYVTPAVAAYFI